MPQTTRNPAVLIIGAGMTGILMTIKLRAAGITDIVVLEKSDCVGGTWRENTYPGAACDVPSHMYTYSFEPNPNWSHLFARGPEIKQYFEDVADKYAVKKDIRFNEAVTDAAYHQGRWTIKSSLGNIYYADFVVCASGILHHPKFPDIEGLADFKGRVFHTAQWDHSVDIDQDTRVGVIGTGSTAAQAIPELVNTGAQVLVFQRTAQWLMHLPDLKISKGLKKVMRRFPLITRFVRHCGRFFLEHFFTKAVTGHFWQKHLLEFACKTNLKLSIKDPALRAKLTPDYQVGCKRVVINSTFYRGMQRPNAQLITQQIQRITATGIQTTDGTDHPLDVLVLSTGFDAFRFMRPMNLTGQDNLHIDKAWQHKIKAYRSMMLPDYPNFFLMLGPNTPIGNFSVIAMSEVQGDYVIKMIDKWRARQFDEFSATAQAVVDFNAYVKEGLAGTSWVGGCQSWYLDPDGDPILWPYTWQRWVDEMKEPQMQHMHTRSFNAMPADE